MKYTLWVALATGLAGLTGLHATSTSPDIIITETPLAVAKPVTIVNTHASDQAIANANVAFVDAMYDNQQRIQIPKIIPTRSGDRTELIPAYSYDLAPQKVFNNGNATNDNVAGAQTDGAPKLYVQ